MCGSFPGGSLVVPAGGGEGGATVADGSSRGGGSSLVFTLGSWEHNGLVEWLFKPTVWEYDGLGWVMTRLAKKSASFQTA